MNTYLKIMCFIALTLPLISGCKTPAVREQPAEGAVPKAPAYQTVLGKSLGSAEVSDFILSNACYSAGEFQVCKEVGMSLWIGSDQIVKTVWLYSGHADGFRRYRGELPFGLTFYDPMWRVEEKLSTVDAEEISQATHELGLPDEGISPDHLHYWAVYKRFGLIIIYDFPYPDEDAYIYAIVVKV